MWVIKILSNRYVIVCGALLAHLIMVQLFFPIDEVLNDAPIINFDHPFHQERTMDRARYIADGGVIWGYNPRLMAGYIDGILALNDGLTHWVNFLMLDKVNRYRIYKLWILLSLFLPVIIMPMAMSLLGLKRLWPLSLLLTVMLVNSNDFIHEFYEIGMEPFIISNFVSLLSVASFWSYSIKKNMRAFFLVLLLLPCSFLFHPLSFFLQIVGYSVIFLGTFRSYKIRHWLLLCILLVTTVGINWHWINVFLEFKSFERPGVDLFFRSSVFDFVEDFFFDVHKLSTTLLCAFGVVGLWRIQRTPALPLLFLTFAIPVFFLTLLTYCGKQMGLSWVQPYRFFISIPIFLLPATSYGVDWGIKSLYEHLSPKKLIPLACLLFVGIFPAFGYHFKHFLDYHNVKPTVRARRTTTILPAELAWLIEWIKNNTNKKARIAIQEIGENAPIGKSHCIPFIASETQREIIGNYHYKAHTIYGVASVDHGFLDIPFETLTQETFKEKCELYNIQHLVLHEETSKDIVKTFSPFAQSVAEFGSLKIFKINTAPSFFLVGTGTVAADLNRIKVSGAFSPETVIKYHYFGLFRANPDLPVERYPIPGDSVGFIKIRNGSIAEFEIFVDYSAISTLDGP